MRFESALPEEEILQVAADRLDDFKLLPGLLQKYYVKFDGPNQFGGIYVWDSKEALAAFRESDLAASIPEAYKVQGKPRVETIDGLFTLRS